MVETCLFSVLTGVLNVCEVCLRCVECISSDKLFALHCDQCFQASLFLLTFSLYIEQKLLFKSHRLLS
ncbi:hypothetical protein FKM82_003173 [Ascaphus truei]